MINSSKFVLISMLLLPISAQATNLKQFNTECTFLKNTISGTNTTGGEIIKADESAVHEFSVDLVAMETCTFGACSLPSPIEKGNHGEFITSRSDSGGVADEDGDIYDLQESFNPKNDIFTLVFTYYASDATKVIGTSRIDYKCNILPFNKDEVGE